uniref:Uncharacterized protein n=1 Tax=Anopheles melas TaxID=34690 RepID=A0A182U5X6_9DIPT
MPVEKKAVTANGGSTVLNPFAQAKNKVRLSLDSGAGQQKPEKKDKLRRSLPSQFVEEPMEVDESPMNENVAEEPSKSDDDKEMNDEVEVVENQEPENGKQQSKAPKPKRKALEDYDLANILSRCNEVIREDKERKKEVASAIRKKKEEKKRLRELEKQEELVAAKVAAAAAAAAGSGGTINDDGGLNSSTTGNDSLGQGGEGLKKKKKRKPKVKNYLLEELAETKKERLEQALRHKLEIVERRKQRKKERQLEQQKQLDKENGNATGASGGIGAKLEKIKKKQKAKSNQESSDKSNNPPVRVALSAFAVFNQLQNHPEQVQSEQEHKTQKSEKSELMAPTVENKQYKKSPKKEAASDPQPEAKEAVKTIKVAVADEKAKQATALKDSEQTKKKKRTERQLDGSDPSFSDEKLLSTDVVVAASTKKAMPAVQTQSESSAVKSDSKINPLLSKSASDGLVQEVEKLTKKQKRKLAAMETTPTNPQKYVTPEGVPAKSMEMKASSFEEAQTNSVAAKRKEKMRNQTVLESDTVPKQKKNKKQTAQNGHEADHSSKLAGSKSASAMDENHTDGQEVVEKKNKKAKKHHAVQPEIDTDQDRSTVEQSRKKTAILERESTTTALAAASAVPTKKRKREQTDSPAATVASTPRPAKHTKLRVLQRIESGGFFEENVTPDKIRLKRNFGFQERQATPAKQLGFRVSSLLPTDQNELRAVASSSKPHSKDGRMKSKHGGSVLSGPPSRSLPLPVWTSSGVFIESSVDDNGNTDGKQRKQQPGSNHKTDTGYIQLKGQGKADFRLKTLRPGPAAEKPHRVDPSTTEQSVLNFKRKQLLEKTAHLREKKKSKRVVLFVDIKAPDYLSASIDQRTSHVSVYMG